MPTLLVRGVPDALYQQLKRRASLNHRSLTQEAISILESGMRTDTPPQKPAPEAVKYWLRREVWTLPILDGRAPDEILGYNDDGLFD